MRYQISYGQERFAGELSENWQSRIKTSIRRGAKNSTWGKWSKAKSEEVWRSREHEHCRATIKGFLEIYQRGYIHLQEKNRTSLKCHLSKSLQITNFVRPDVCESTSGHTDRKSSLHFVPWIVKYIWSEVSQKCISSHRSQNCIWSHRSRNFFIGQKCFLPAVFIKDEFSVNLVKIWSK